MDQFRPFEMRVLRTLVTSLLSEDEIVGIAGDLCVGFIAHVGDHEVALECHVWGEQPMLPSFRDQDVQLSILGPQI